MEPISTVHVNSGDMEKCRTRRRRRGRGRGRGGGPGRWWGSRAPLFCNVNSGDTTVHVAEQWRHGAEGGGGGGGGGAAALGGGEGAALHCSSTWTVESPLFTLQNSWDMVQKEKEKEKGKEKGKGWMFLCCKARHCYCVVTQLQQKQPQAALEKEKGKGKGKGWLSLCCKACHCLLCCNIVATKAAPSCFDRCCVANARKGGAHEQ